MSEEEPETEEVEEETILCDSCEWFILKKGKPKCKFVKEKDRIAMLESGIKCPEYLMAHRLQVE
ncbi:MAG: hypothetical protein ACTSRG_02800 [Candidatus Helarchaeota archaeon]